jgi:hypothetical protein
MHESFDVVFGVWDGTLFGGFRTGCDKLPFVSLHAIRTKRLAEQLTDVAVLVLGDCDNLLRQGIREANGENSRGSAARSFNGSAHAAIMTEYDNFIQALFAGNGLAELLH